MTRWRRSTLGAGQADMPTRPEALRRLMEKALSTK
jgi:hypothetical protein